MKAITLHQPWATLMAMGVKRIETRSWATRHRGPLAIHAAKTFPAYAKDACYSTQMLRALGWPQAERVSQGWLDGINAQITALPLGAIVATVDLVACLDTDLILRGYIHPRPDEMELACGNYEAGRFGWVTQNLRVVDPPIPYIGAQGLWDWHEADEVI